MHVKLINFIKYNNAFTILLALFFFGFGVSFAAEPAIRDSFYSSQETVVSVDNSYILSTDLNSHNFNLKINSITEDEKNYYATYSYQTIQIIDSVWQNKQVEKTLTVSKEVLEGKDLGLYLAKQLGENINYELSYLQKVQKLEKEKGESQKMITTEYSGLIGKLLDTKQEVIEGYNPVISEVVPEVPVTVEENPQEVIVSTQYPEQTTTEQTTTEQPTEQTSTETEPTTEQTPIEQNPLTDAINSPQSDEGQATIEQTPEPTQTVNEELIQKVVDVLLENNEPVTPAPAVTEPTPSNISEQANTPQEPPLAPEVVSEPIP